MKIKSLKFKSPSVLTLEISSRLKSLADDKRAKILGRFFKTGPGQYGEGDRFLGVTVPDQRKIVQNYWSKISLSEIEQLLFSPTHEIRLTSLLLLVKLTQKNPHRLREFVNFYLQHTEYINNWDLVDLTAPNILGQYLLQYPSERKVLKKLIKSKSIREQRIAILAILPLLKKGEGKELFEMVDEIISHPHDLLHKAMGWMLRELGKKNWQPVEKFLRSPLTFENKTKPRYMWLPRTTLRYCLEKRPKNEYQNYLTGKITTFEIE